MKISNFSTTQNSEQLEIRATISADAIKEPATVWFKLLSNHKDLVETSTADAFAATALLLAMRLNEDLYIDAPVSASFLESMQKVMDLVSTWKGVGWPELKPIKIIANNIVEIKKVATGKRAAFFSLGLDSFHTLQESEKDPATKLDYLILVHGFDIFLDNPELFETVRKNSQAVADATGKELVLIQTNIRILVDQILMWDAAHGAGLAAAGLFLAKGLDKIYINSGDRRSTEFPNGTRFDLDKLWSSDQIEVSTFGIGKKRLHKIQDIAHNKLAQKYLRVCWRNPDNEYNCSRCPKCVANIFLLRTTGQEKKFITFNHDISLATLAGITEPRTRVFWWNDIFLSLPLKEIRLRYYVSGIIFRSYYKFLKGKLASYL